MSFAKNNEGARELTDTSNYYPFCLNHIAVMLRISGFGVYYPLVEASRRFTVTIMETTTR